MATMVVVAMNLEKVEACVDDNLENSPVMFVARPFPLNHRLVVETVGDGIWLYPSFDHLMVDSDCEGWSSQLHTLFHEDTVTDLRERGERRKERRGEERERGGGDWRGKRGEGRG